MDKTPAEWMQLLDKLSKVCTFNILNAFFVLYSGLTAQRKDEG